MLTSTLIAGANGTSMSPTRFPDRGLRDVRPGRGLGERLTFLDDTTNDFPTGRAG